MRPNPYLGQSFKPEEITARRIELERIAMLSGRPSRTTVINSDDIINMLIALHKTQDINDFIRSI
jgi:hypothetical protein